MSIPVYSRLRTWLLPAVSLLYLSFSCSPIVPEEASAMDDRHLLAAPAPDNYIYSLPSQKADGWSVANIYQENKAEELVNKMRADKTLGLSGVLLSQEGKLVLEEYREGWNADTLLPLHENELLVIATLTAITQQVQKGLIQRLVNIPFGNYAVKKKVSPDTAVDVQHLLKMETGLLCKPQNELMEASLKQNDAKRFYYCPANYQAIAQWIEVVTDEPLSFFAEEQLFEPLTIDHYLWDDLELSMPARDMLKFSALYAQKGKWGQKEVMANDWVLQLQARGYDSDLIGQFAYGWWQQRLLVSGRQYAVFYSKGPNYMLVLIPDLEGSILLTGDLARSASAYFPFLQEQAIPALLQR